ncbi:MAG: radical SAM protein [archaeon]
MRDEYKKFFYDQIRKGNIGIVPKVAYQYFGTILGRMIGKPLVGPMNGCIVVTYACNLRCQMCDLVERVKTKNKQLTTDEIKKVLDDYAKIGTIGIGLTGGEPFIRSDMLEIIRYTKEVGLIAHMSSNGFNMTKDNAKKILDAGLDAIAFSLDGSTSKTHDKVRGVKGSFDMVMRGIDNFVHLKRITKKYKHFTIVVTCSVNKYNIDEVLDIVKIAKQKGVDYISFIPFHDIGELTNNVATMQDLKVTKEQLHKLDVLVDKLIQLRRKTKFIDTSEEYLKLFKHCFRGEPLPIKCYAGYVTLVVGAFGEIYPCFPFMEGKKVFANVRDIPLRKYWESNHFNCRRKNMKNCRQCYWNNQTETNLLFNFRTIK